VWVVDTDAKGTATSRIQPVKIALAEGQVTILESGLQQGQNVVVDGADRLRAGQIVLASMARQRPGQGAGGQGSGQGGGSKKFSTGSSQPNTLAGGSSANTTSGSTHQKREQQ